jgi:hypothetical protein
LYQPIGLMAEWSCSGLQIRVRRFDSDSGLHPNTLFTALRARWRLGTYPEESAMTRKRDAGTPPRRLDPAHEAEAWYAEAFQRAAYRRADDRYEDYQPAYRYGGHARSQHGDREWDEALESELEREWHERRGSSKLDWAHARHAVWESYDFHGGYEHGTYLPEDDGGPSGGRFQVR